MYKNMAQNSFVKCFICEQNKFENLPCACIYHIRYIIIYIKVYYKFSKFIFSKTKRHMNKFYSTSSDLFFHIELPSVRLYYDQPLALYYVFEYYQHDNSQSVCSLKDFIALATRYVWHYRWRSMLWLSDKQPGEIGLQHRETVVRLSRRR